MDIIRNFPFFSIMLSMFAAIVTSVLNGRAAKNLTRAVLLLDTLMSAVLLFMLYNSGSSFVFYMGHFPAPWGNEIRAGELEALMALFVSFVALMSVTAGMQAIFVDVDGKKMNMYFILIDLMVSSLLALIYTNDLFTAYVFIEINTIAGCGLIMVRQIGKSIVTAVRYMVISLLGSGLFLIGVTLLYTITGHLLMSNIKETVDVLVKTGQYRFTLIVIVSLMTVGLAIKSGLFPFHLWIPDAYGYSNVTSSAILSGIVSKGYIFLLIKIYYRVIGMEFVVESKVINIVFVFGVIAIIVGSVMAIREPNLRRMIAYSSVAQIGYIYMGIGLGTTAGMVAAIFHILAHGLTKSLLFLSSAEFTEGSHSKFIDDMYGLARKYKYSAFFFSVGALSMTGFPLLAGFVSKLLFSDAAIGHKHKMFIALFALAISTILNAIYFMRTIITLYSAKKTGAEMVQGKGYVSHFTGKLQYFGALFLLTVVNFVLGMNSQKIIDIITNGLKVFD